MQDIRVAVVGSVVRDRICKVEALPMPGETAIAKSVDEAWGGKGANQAHAAARLGIPTFFLGKVGDDEAGRGAAKDLAAAPFEVALLTAADAPTGRASVVVDEDGENLIVVELGANAELSAADVEAHRDVLARARVLVTQLEVPDETVRAVAALGEETGATTILNVAPMREGAADLLSGFDVAIVNRSEAEVLAGVGIATMDDAFAAARAIGSMGVRHAVVTLGAAGAAFLYAGSAMKAAAPEVDAVDATGAGDAFVGALAAFLAGGADLEDATPRACRVAALATTALGARAAHPTLEALGAFEAERGIEA